MFCSTARTRALDDPSRRAWPSGDTRCRAWRCVPRLHDSSSTQSSQASPLIVGGHQVLPTAGQTGWPSDGPPHHEVWSCCVWACGATGTHTRRRRSEDWSVWVATIARVRGQPADRYVRTRIGDAGPSQRSHACPRPVFGGSPFGTHIANYVRRAPSCMTPIVSA